LKVVLTFDESEAFDATNRFHNFVASHHRNPQNVGEG